jgi:hypothetical protein
MDNQEITHKDEGGKESFKFTQRGYMWLNPETLKWSYCNPAFSLRSLADIKRIVELEKERDVYASAFHQLKDEFVRCDNCGDQSECKDFDIFNGGTVDWLQSDRDLNQQADGIESLITSSDTIERSSMNSRYRREAIKLRNKASALKELKT